MTILVLLFWTNIAQSQSRFLEIWSEENPPYNYTEEISDEFVGIATDILKLALTRENIEFRIKSVPWNRALDQVSARPQNCVYVTNRTPQREDKFLWVGPIVTGGFAFFVMQDSPITAQTLDELRAAKIGAQANSGFAEFLRSQGISPHVESTEFNNLPLMLAAGRFDVLADGRHAGAYRAKKAKVRLRRLFVVKETELYLACNLSTQTNLMDGLNFQLAKIVRSDEAEGIIQRYINPEISSEPIKAGE